VTNLGIGLLESKVEMKDVGEAMFVVLVVALTFVVVIAWAKWSKRKRSGK
jgi:membrane protein DedA with SNARE-associated domain